MSKRIIIVCVAAFLLFSIPVMAESWLFSDEDLDMDKTRDDGYMPGRNMQGHYIKHSPETTPTPGSI